MPLIAEDGIWRKPNKEWSERGCVFLVATALLVFFTKQLYLYYWNGFKSFNLTFVGNWQKVYYLNIYFLYIVYTIAETTGKQFLWLTLHHRWYAYCFCSVYCTCHFVANCVLSKFLLISLPKWQCFVVIALSWYVMYCYHHSNWQNDNYRAILPEDLGKVIKGRKRGKIVEKGGSS